MSISFFWTLQIPNLEKKREENICMTNYKYNVHADLTMCFLEAVTHFNFNQYGLYYKNYQLP